MRVLYFWSFISLCLVDSVSGAQEIEGMRISTPTIEDQVSKSPLAASTKDPQLGFNAVFPPVPSCLSKVVLVIYVQFLDLLSRLDEFKNMYGPFFASIEFYVDGTWCDPRSSQQRNSASAGYPCYGASLDSSVIPEEVHVVDRNGGGWMMQRSFVDAVLRPRPNYETPSGFLFITDDVLLNMGQLSRAVNTSGCDVIWRSALGPCADVESDGRKKKVFQRFSREARAFFEVSDDRFRARLEANLGSPSTYCMGVQNDFLYMPTLFAKDWARVSNDMTDAGLVFTFAFYTAIFGIARLEDMVILQSHYLDRSERADQVLRGATLRAIEEPFCWTGQRGNISELLSSHIIHPNKAHHSTQEWDFARTVNPPAAALNVSRWQNSSSSHPSLELYNEDAATAFWCKV